MLPYWGCIHHSISTTLTQVVRTSLGARFALCRYGLWESIRLPTWERSLRETLTYRILSPVEAGSPEWA